MMNVTYGEVNHYVDQSGCKKYEFFNQYIRVDRYGKTTISLIAEGGSPILGNRLNDVDLETQYRILCQRIDEDQCKIVAKNKVIKVLQQHLLVLYCNDVSSVRMTYQYLTNHCHCLQLMLSKNNHHLINHYNLTLYKDKSKQLYHLLLNYIKLL